MKLAAALIVWSISINSLAGDYKNYWKADIYPSGCVAVLHFTGTFAHQDRDDSDPIMDVNFTIASPNSSYIGDEMEQLGEGEAHLLLLIQPFLWYLHRGEGIEFANPSVKTPMGTYTASPSKLLQDPDMPGFVIAGSSVQEIWDQIVDGNPVTIHFELSPGVQHSIEIEGEYLDQVSRMFRACIG